MPSNSNSKICFLRRKANLLGGFVMKTKLFFIVSFLLICYVSNIYSQDCPSGYSQTFVDLTVHGCLYKVEICYKCTAGPSGWDEIQVFGFAAYNHDCEQEWDYNQILQGIYSQVYTGQFFQNLCQQLMHPCDGRTWEYLHVQYFYNKCWEKWKHDGLIWYVPCNLSENCQCIEIWRFCWDAINGLQSVRTSGPNYYCLEQYECTTPEAEVPDPRNENDISNCFYLWTPCQ